MIYLDNAATTKVADQVLEAMLPYYKEFYGNPGSIHSQGLKAAEAVEKARESIASSINAQPENIIFTSGGSEANSLAILGVADYLKKIGKRHIITTCVEHKSVLNSIKQLFHKDFECTFLNVSEQGYLSMDELKQSIRPDTGLVSIMGMNNETGNLYDVEKIGKICRTNNVLFHTDCVQAYGCIPIDVEEYNIDFLSASGHKIYATKGVGFLFARDKDMLAPIIYGGGQEFGLRSGTENVPGIVGFGVAASLFTDTDCLYRTQYHNAHMREVLLNELDSNINDFRQNGVPCPESKIINLRFDGVDGETLLLLLNSSGVCVSSGAACNSHDSVPSHVLKSLGLTDEQARSSIRISFSPFTTLEETFNASSIIVDSVKKLRGDW